MKKHIVVLFLSLQMAIFAGAVFANTLNLYAKPEVQAKVIATAEAGDQLIPIFYPEKSAWIKVANPKNGDVGWVKFSELQGPFVISSYNGTMQQQVFFDHNKAGQPESYSVVEISGPKPLKPEDAKAMLKDMQSRQEEIQNSMQKSEVAMQKMMQEMFKGLTYDHNFFTFPIIQPVIVVPQNQKIKPEDSK